jgi:hypothetical protein
MMFGRRTFLVGAAAAVGGGLFYLASPRSFVAAAIRDHFAPGQVSEDDIAAFSDDFMTNKPEWDALKHRVFGRLGVLGLSLAPYLDGPSRMRDDAITAFLLGSTAMQITEPDDPVIYLTFPDPYQTGCFPAFA